MLIFLLLLLTPILFLDSCSSQNLDGSNLRLDNSFSTMEDNLLKVEDDSLALEDNFLTVEDNFLALGDNFLAVENNFKISSQEDEDNEVSVTPTRVSEPKTVVGLLGVTIVALGIKIYSSSSK